MTSHCLYLAPSVLGDLFLLAAPVLLSLVEQLVDTHPGENPFLPLKIIALTQADLHDKAHRISIPELLDECEIAGLPYYGLGSSELLICEDHLTPPGVGPAG